MTPTRRAAETANKRAERLRRKEAGEVRIEAWINKDALADLEALKGRWSMQSQSEVIVRSLRVATRDNHVEITSTNNEVVINDANLRWIREHLE